MSKLVGDWVADVSGNVAGADTSDACTRASRRRLASARIKAWRSSADMDLSWGAGERDVLVGVAGGRADGGALIRVVGGVQGQGGGERAAEEEPISRSRSRSL